ncbi:hypothetical protein EIO_1967 [Ketogulonicigenium vulgare Y25]|uniref:Uncharacterized protein n=1 Tax=Ketogulonicigenium vulgare (strain WSH-001) TaxID=759362 RepID=F9Y946_KETVW|nr:hypothetical protein EIO_1967 [Ketogulonicigenium vulgare Y25]AEM41263.1 hypothetical protein KVU_1424 [Ketogulonicigenium vulgare WSH-001]ALJ81401.1 hypothetical protein KVH_09540 [Ketogulonicigenium vulgare]ANW35078.1 hypothetical protein KvSKV_09490 [Ketogulonicigenium vulgare]AOZ54996.1 hypothetical protein KVC_1989 [Ketogulonicigenium vulgare]
MIFIAPMFSQRSAMRIILYLRLASRAGDQNPAQQRPH